MIYTRRGFDASLAEERGITPMASEGSVTRWIGLLQEGDLEAAQPLWERYFRRLVDLARRKLLGARPQAADEEDVALSAFHSFCQGLKEGRFPDLQDRDNLWKLLVVLTARKACHLIRDETAQKRGGARRAGDAADMEQAEAPEPSPEFAAELADNCQRLLALLPQGELRGIALLKMDGLTNEEIARQLNISGRTVERRLKLIRGLWQKDCTP
jgi:RNA polymerase sigma factor (sigma-70 family)